MGRVWSSPIGRIWGRAYVIRSGAPRHVSASIRPIPSLLSRSTCALRLAQGNRSTCKREPSSVDAFEVHRRLIADYQAFTEGFVSARDERVAEAVTEQSAKGTQWPDPWRSLNPSFAPGGRFEELVAAGLLNEECQRILRPKRTVDDTGTSSLLLHCHQREAIEAASCGNSYVLTTGTGSGKSLRGACGGPHPVPDPGMVHRTRDGVACRGSAHISESHLFALARGLRRRCGSARRIRPAGDGRPKPGGPIGERPDPDRGSWAQLDQIQTELPLKQIWVAVESQP